MQDTDSIRRLLEDELGACTDGDVATRVDELESLDETVPTTPDADLRALKALGNPTRNRIVQLLVAADGELCVCEFAPLLAVSDSAISHALSDLHAAELVERRREGNWRYYRPTERARRLVAALEGTREGSDE